MTTASSRMACVNESQMNEAYEVESRIDRLSEIAALTYLPHVLDDTPVKRTGGAVAPRLHGQS